MSGGGPAADGAPDSPVGVHCLNVPSWASSPPIESVIFAWGASEDHQLGVDSEADIAAPKVVESLLGIKFMGRSFFGCPLVGGSRNTLALDAEGGLWSWGWNDRGTLGHGHRELQRKPACVEALAGVRIVQAAIGGWHCLALSDEGQVYAWGGNEYQQCGLLEPDHHQQQHAAAAAAAAEAAGAAGGAQEPRSANGRTRGVLAAAAAALAGGGSPGAAGGGSPGAAGGGVLPPERDILVPRRCMPGLVVRQVACGGMNSVVLTEGGEVWTWGEPWGEFALEVQRTPRKVPGAVNIAAIACGGFHNMALVADGRVLTWGTNDHGQLGNGSTIYSTTPVEVVDLEGVPVSDIAAGGWHSMALTADGQIYVWGRGEYGRLGIADRTGSSKLRPHKVRGLEAHVVVQVAAGGTHSLAVTSAGRIFIWGRASYGRLGLGQGAKDAYSPVEVVLPGGHERWKIAAATAGGRHTMCLAVPVRELSQRAGSTSGNSRGPSRAGSVLGDTNHAAGGGGGGNSNSSGAANVGAPPPQPQPQQPQQQPPAAGGGGGGNRGAAGEQQHVESSFGSEIQLTHSAQQQRLQLLHSSQRGQLHQHQHAEAPLPPAAAAGRGAAGPSSLSRHSSAAPPGSGDDAPGTPGAPGGIRVAPSGQAGGGGGAAGTYVPGAALLHNAALSTQSSYSFAPSPGSSILGGGSPARGGGAIGGAGSGELALSPGIGGGGLLRGLSGGHSMAMGVEAIHAATAAAAVAQLGALRVGSPAPGGAGALPRPSSGGGLRAAQQAPISPRAALPPMSPSDRRVGFEPGLPSALALARYGGGAEAGLSSPRGGGGRGRGTGAPLEAQHQAVRAGLLAGEAAAEDDLMQQEEYEEQRELEEMDRDEQQLQQRRRHHHHAKQQQQQQQHGRSASAATPPASPPQPRRGSPDLAAGVARGATPGGAAMRRSGSSQALSSLPPRPWAGAGEAAAAQAQHHPGAGILHTASAQAGGAGAGAGGALVGGMSRQQSQQLAAAVAVSYGRVDAARQAAAGGLPALGGSLGSGRMGSNVLRVDSDLSQGGLSSLTGESPLDEGLLGASSPTGSADGGRGGSPAGSGGSGGARGVVSLGTSPPGGLYDVGLGSSSLPGREAIHLNTHLS